MHDMYYVQLEENESQHNTQTSISMGDTGMTNNNS